MSKKLNKPAQTTKPTPAARKPLPKRLILILIAILVGGFAAWKFWPGESAGYEPGSIHGVEETLTAKNRLPQLRTESKLGAWAMACVLQAQL